MSEMLDRVRKVIHERGAYDTPWETCSQCEDDARAILAVIRDPTEAMIERGSDARRPGNSRWGNSHDTWKAMIDEALK